MAIYEGLQSCERLRLALESFEPEKDQEGFVRYYGTGNAMPNLSPNSESSTMDCQLYVKRYSPTTLALKSQQLRSKARPSPRLRPGPRL